MKHIDKNPEPEEFCEWKDRFREQEIEPGWGEFDGTPMKQTIKQSLLAEQGYLCCFCEIEVDENKGHIAHLLDQAGHPDKVLVYENLLYSCPERPRSIPQTCGHAQKNAILPISPLDTDCETRFLYTGNGRIHPRKIDGNDDRDAAETIRILNLNAKRLIEIREMVFQEVFMERSKQMPTDFQDWIKTELMRIDGRFTNFWTVKKYVSTMPLYSMPQDNEP